MTTSFTEYQVKLMNNINAHESYPTGMGVSDMINAHIVARMRYISPNSAFNYITHNASMVSFLFIHLKLFLGELDVEFLVIDKHCLMLDNDSILTIHTAASTDHVLSKIIAPTHIFFNLPNKKPSSFKHTIAVLQNSTNTYGDEFIDICSGISPKILSTYQ